MRRHLGAVRCTQVLAIHAQDDEVASPRNLQLLAQGLPASCSLQAQTVHNSYHMISIDNEKARVLSEMKDFLQAAGKNADPSVTPPAKAVVPETVRSSEHVRA